MQQSTIEEQSFQKPFRFLDLPLELQYQILEYTDSVAPRRDITWNPKDGFYLHYCRLFCEDDDDCPPEIHSSCQLRDCNQVLDNGCFCRRHHAAFSPIWNCRCPPMPYFSSRAPFALIPSISSLKIILWSCLVVECILGPSNQHHVGLKLPSF